MRVLLVNHFPLQGSGSGIYTMNIANELVKEGHEIGVIDIDNQIDNTRYGFSRHTILCDKDKNENADLPFNFPCFTTHPRSNMTFYNLSDEDIALYVDVYCKKIGEVVENFPPDIIHAQHLWVAPYAALQSGIPYVITAHGTDLMGFRNDSRYHPFAIAGVHGAQQIITISHQVNNEVKELYSVPDDKLTLNPNGFSEDIFRIKEVDRKAFLNRYKIPDEKQKIISFVGKFTEFKGIDILIKAIPKINKLRKDVIFLLAGDGELRQELEEEVRQKTINNCFFLGHLAQEDIASLYNLAELSIIPSRVEPFGLVAIEALACGTPVIATKAGGLPDFINNKVGSLIAMDNPEKLTQAIEKNLKNNAKIKKGAFAAKYAARNYSWHQTLKNVIKIYKESIQKIKRKK